MKEENKKNNKPFIISNILILIIVLCGIGYFSYEMLKSENIEENLEYMLRVEISSNHNICHSHDTNCVTYEIKTSTKNARYLDFSGEDSSYGFILYEDNGFKIYNTDTKKIQKLENLSDNYDGNYELVTDKDVTKCLGIVFRSNQGNQDAEKYYSIKDKKMITENIITINYLFDFIGLLYEDNGLKAYNVYSNESQALNLESTYKTYSLSGVDNKLLGIYYANDTENGYYNVVLDKKLYQNQYSGFIEAISENYLQVTGGAECNGVSSYVYLLSSTEEKLLFSAKELGKNCTNFSVKEYKDKAYIMSSNGTFYPTYDIYTQDKKLIVSDVKPYVFDYDDNGNLNIIDNNTIKKYDINGNLLETNKDYNNILGFAGKYLAYVENNTLKVKSLSDKNIIDIVKWDSNYVYKGDFAFSNDNQIYIPIAYKDRLNEYGLFDKYDANNGIEIYYDLKTKEITTKEIVVAFSNQYLD